MSSPDAPADSPALIVPAGPPMSNATDPAVGQLPSLAHAEIATARRYADASRAASTQRGTVNLGAGRLVRWS